MEEDKTIPVIEIFGPVFQGEGIMAGCRTHFLRTGGCDYKCKWCDTMYAVDPQQVKRNATRMTQSEIFGKLTSMEHRGKVLTISGGNPCMHDLTDLAFRLKASGWTLAVETQGTLYRPWVAQYCDVVTISPKPPSAGNQGIPERIEQQFRDFLEAVKVNDVCVKVVVFNQEDFDFALRIYGTTRMHVPNAHFYVQPGTNIHLSDSIASQRKDILQRTAAVQELVLKTDLDDIFVMPQLHTLIYGSAARGV
jgi:7-carboxy-7-deazaguanine synthase